jgi:hypothetical protein
MIRRLLTSGLFVFVFSAISYAQESPLPQCDPRNARVERREVIPIPTELTSFEGSWVGTLEGAQGKGLFPKCIWNHTVRIEVGRKGVVVSFRTANGWKHFDTDAQIVIKDTNAIISASHSSTSSNWVETWVFVFTKKSANTALATWNRVVNNFALPPEDEQRVYAFAAAGEMKLDPTIR